MPDLTDAEVEMTDFGTYTEEQFYADLGRITDYRCDPELADTLVTRSKDTLMWMASHGVRFAPIWGRQAFKVDGRFRFWGGLTVESVGGGEGLVESLRAALARNEIDLWHEAAARSLLTDDAGAVCGLRVRLHGTDGPEADTAARAGVRMVDVQAGAVVLAAGGFQANAEWRTPATSARAGISPRCAAPASTPATASPWRSRPARCRTATGAAPTPWPGTTTPPSSATSPWATASRSTATRSAIVLNQQGERFVDEGADFRNYTYARYGREILAQPGHSAWQVFDASTDHLLRDEYRIRQVTKVTANTIEELCARMEDVHTEAALATIAEFNAAVDRSVEFDPNVLDGRRTRGLSPDKTNWAMPIETPPFSAFRVTCGLTFTFGGLRIDQSGCVIDTDLRPITGLYAAGELVGGLFYGNYPGGSGLSAGAVFGRLAGTSAAAHATG